MPKVYLDMAFGMLVGPRLEAEVDSVVPDLWILRRVTQGNSEPKPHKIFRGRLGVGHILFLGGLGPCQ